MYLKQQLIQSDNVATTNTMFKSINSLRN